MNTLILKLSQNESIKIITEENIDFNQIDFCCSELQAYFISAKEELLCIGEQTAGLLLEAFIGVLKKAVDCKLQLHESIKQNLGFMSNEYYHNSPYEKPEFIMVSTSDDSCQYWVGSNYEIWAVSSGSNQYVSTWMYNDDEGNIVFEVTKFYKWSLREKEPEDLDFITYEEFMKDYKPLIHRVIPRDVAIEWLEQAMKIHRGFFSTEEDYQKLCKMLNW